MASAGSIVSPEDVRHWGQQLDEVTRRIGTRIPRSETRTRVRAHLAGLLGPAQRKNAWQVAEQVGDADPYGVQYLMSRAEWGREDVRDDPRSYVVQSLGDPDAVLILDETGFLKKGGKSAGAARQYTGTAGWIENAQVGVFLAYASRHGTAFLDRALYLPKEWTDGSKRCEAAGIPEGTAFTTEIQLAKAMLERAFKAGVPVGWVTGDEVYGAWELRRWLEEQRRPQFCSAPGLLVLEIQPVIHRPSLVRRRVPSSSFLDRVNSGVVDSLGLPRRSASTATRTRRRGAVRPRYALDLAASRTSTLARWAVTSSRLAIPRK